MSPPLHRIVERQLRASGASRATEPDATAWERLITRLDRHYRAVDDERYLLDRSMAIAAEEMSALHERISADRAQLQALVAALPQGMMVLDADGTVQITNPALHRMLGRPIDRADRLKVVDGHGTRVPLQRAPSLQVYLVGTARHVPVQVDHVDLDRGRVLWTFTDLTERMKARSALEKARLEALVAQKAERAKARFLARVSHELRTPLNAIIGYAELIQEEGPSHPNQVDLSRIHQAGQHLLELINDVLDLTKVDADQMTLHPQAVDLHTLVAVLVQDHATQAADGVTLRIDAEPLGLRLVDPVRLRQCLDNLIANALRYTDAGEVVVTIAAHGPRVHITVRDSGCGIPPHELDSVFEPFQQAAGARGGTGLGLTMVRTLAELMHGTIGVQSEVGVGSRFTLDLPLRRVDDARSAQG